MNNTQLTNFRDFEPTSRVLFSKPEAGSIQGSLPKITFKRIRLNVKNVDGSIGELVLETPPNLLSYGLQENLDMQTGKVNGYSFPVCLWNRNGASEEEKLFVEKLNLLVEVCKQHLVENRESIEKYDLEMNDLKKFNPLYWKTEKGKIIEDRGPMLYLKVLENKKMDKISTLFIDDDTNVILDPMELLNKRCLITGAIKVESIFIGNKISIQLKLSEVVVKVFDTSIRGLLRPIVVQPLTSATTLEPQSSTMPLSTTTVTESSRQEEQVTNENDDDLSIYSEDDEDGYEEVQVDNNQDMTSLTIPPVPSIPVESMSTVNSSASSITPPPTIETTKVDDLKAPKRGRGRKAVV